MGGLGCGEGGEGGREGGSVELDALVRVAAARLSTRPPSSDSVLFPLLRHFAHIGRACSAVGSGVETCAFFQSCGGTGILFWRLARTPCARHVTQRHASAALSSQPKLAKTSPATGASRGSTASVSKVSRASVACRSASSKCSNVSMGCQSRRIHSAPTACVTTLFARQKAEMQLLCRKSRTPWARRHFTDRQRGRLCPSARDVTSRPRVPEQILATALRKDRASTARIDQNRRANRAAATPPEASLTAHSSLCSSTPPSPRADNLRLSAAAKA